VPEDRPSADLHHGLRDIIDVASEPHPGSTAKKYDFHGVLRMILTTATETTLYTVGTKTVSIRQLI
jgi:hypothetical protein